MEVDSMTNGTRTIIINVNNDSAITLNLSGDNGNLPYNHSYPIENSNEQHLIRKSSSYPPDMDRIIISEDGNVPFPASTTYEGEYATLSGSSNQAFCGNCSGVPTTGNIGGDVQNTMSFTNVTVRVTSIYQM